MIGFLIGIAIGILIGVVGVFIWSLGVAASLDDKMREEHLE